MAIALKTIAVICMVTCARADTFAERWPVVDSVAPAPVVSKPHKPRHVERRCHRQYFYMHKHRYWRCRR